MEQKGVIIIEGRSRDTKNSQVLKKISYTLQNKKSKIILKWQG